MEEAILNGMQPFDEVEKLALEIAYKNVQQKLNEYSDEGVAYNTFENYSQKSRKTLKSFINKETIPHPETLISFYKWIFKEKETHKVIEMMDPVIKAFCSMRGYSLKSQKQNINHIIFKTDLHTYLYFLTSDSNIVSKREIENQFGIEGIKAISELEGINAVDLIHNTFYTTGKIRAEFNLDFYKKTSVGLSSIFPIQKFSSGTVNDAILNTGSSMVLKKDNNKIIKSIAQVLSLISKSNRQAEKQDISKKELLFFNFLCYKASHILDCSQGVDQ